jgi:nucleotide-binding universal stress UspA family protein
MPTHANASTAATAATPNGVPVFPYRHIVCCVDAREGTVPVIAEAVRLRACAEGRLTFAHAFEATPVPEAFPAEVPFLDRVSGLHERTEAWLESLARAQGADPQLIDGYPPDAVVRWARRNDVDLIVAGSHRGVIQRMFLGGFATYLAGHSPCAVLLVRPDGAGPALGAGTVPFRHIAVCVDDSAPSLEALRHARLLRDLGADRLSVIHVAQWPLPYLIGGLSMVIEPTDVFERQRAWLAETVDDARGEQAVYLTGMPATVVCEWAEQEHPDVIVAASHRGVGERILLGSFARHVAYHAPANVLLTRMAPEAEHELGEQPDDQPSEGSAPWPT